MKLFSFSWKSENTSLKDTEICYISTTWKTTFFLNLMTFSKSRHSLDLCITASSPFMRMLLHFCEWLSSFIWLDPAGKWHNEKGKWKSFFFLLENQKIYKSYSNWSVSYLYYPQMTHLNTNSVFYCFVNKWYHSRF